MLIAQRLARLKCDMDASQLPAKSLAKESAIDRASLLIDRLRRAGVSCGGRASPVVQGGLTGPFTVPEWAPAQTPLDWPLGPILNWRIRQILLRAGCESTEYYPVATPEADKLLDKSCMNCASRLRDTVARW